MGHDELRMWEARGLVALCGRGRVCDLDGMRRARGRG